MARLYLLRPGYPQPSPKKRPLHQDSFATERSSTETGTHVRPAEYFKNNGGNRSPRLRYSAEDSSKSMQTSTRSAEIHRYSNGKPVNGSTRGKYIGPASVHFETTFGKTLGFPLDGSGNFSSMSVTKRRNRSHR